MTWKLELWVEGPTDAKVERSGNDKAPDYVGALIPIIRRTLQELSGLGTDAFDRALPIDSMSAYPMRQRLPDVLTELPGRRQISLKGRLLNLLPAFYSLRARQPQTLFVAVWDCDSNKANLDDRDELHKRLRERGDRGLAAGVCVQKLEAWLLADAGAFHRLFGRGPKEPLGDPESVEDPKEPLRKFVAECRGDSTSASAATTYRELAEKIDLGTLSDKCPRGYGTFRDDLSEFIAVEIR